jgi:hypothetical protein
MGVPGTALAVPPKRCPAERSAKRSGPVAHAGPVHLLGLEQTQTLASLLARRLRLRRCLFGIAGMLALTLTCPIGPNVMFVARLGVVCDRFH